MTHTLEFQSRGVTLRGRFSLPRTLRTGRQPLVVMATGDGLSGSNSSTWSLFAEQLSEAGLPSFVFDFVGLGNSDGSSRQLTLSAGLENLAAAVQAVATEDWIDTQRLGLLGSSFGGNVALLYAANHNRIKVMGLKSPVSFYPEVHELMFGLQGMQQWKSTGYNAEYGFDYQFYLNSFHHNTYAAAQHITVPVLIVHGDSDTVVPIIQSRRLLECLAGDAQLISLSGVDHDYASPDAKHSMTEALVTWFAERL